MAMIYAAEIIKLGLS